MSFSDGLGFFLGLGAGSPRVDPACGDKDLGLARKALGFGNGKRAAEAFPKVTGHDERALWARALGELDKPSKAIDAWVDATRGAPDALLVRGAHRIKLAWDARGFGKGSDVSAAGAQLMTERLAAAESDLRECAAASPRDPTPLALLLHVARGQAFESGEVAELLDAACALDPGHYVAHAHALTYRCEKWFGSHDEMFALAREASAGAPDGSRLHGLVARAHVERWFYARAWDEDPDADRLLREAADELRASSRRSVLAPGYPMTPASVEDRNWIAVALWKAGCLNEAGEVLRTLRGELTDFPWAWLGRPAPWMYRTALRETRARR